MRTYRFYWKRTKALGFIVLLGSGCASLKAPYSPDTLGNRDSSYKSVFLREQQISTFRSFCSGQRQIKALKVSFTFVSPKNPKGVPLDLVNKGQGQLDRKGSCLFRNILYQMSSIPCTKKVIPKSCGLELRNDFSFVSTSDSFSEVLENIRSVELEGSEPIFIISEDGNRIVGFFGSTAQTPEGPRRYGISGEYAGTFHRNAVLSDIGSLVKGYTMLEPGQYQKETYGSGDRFQCEPASLRLPIAIDDDGSADISEAIEQRETIWSRYITHHTTVKQSRGEDPQLTNVEVSLDLNPFCRYGRSIDDLTSH